MTDLEIRLLRFIIYCGLNFLATLIWCIIPLIIHMYRNKYNLSPKTKMIIWPVTTEFIERLGRDDDEWDGPTVVMLIGLMGLIGSIVTIPGAITLLTYRGLCKVFNRIFSKIAFSKEERKEIDVQIALGTMEKDNG